MGRFLLRRDFFLAYLQILLAKLRSSKAVCQLEMLIFYALVEYCSKVKEFVTLCTMNRDLLILSEQ